MPNCKQGFAEFGEKWKLAHMLLNFEQLWAQPYYRCLHTFDTPVQDSPEDYIDVVIQLVVGGFCGRGWGQGGGAPEIRRHHIKLRLYYIHWL